VRAALAGDGAASPDQPSVTVGRPHVPRLHGAAAEVLAHHVGGGDQPAKQLLAVGSAQIARDALATAPLDRPEERVGRGVRVVVRCGKRPDRPHEVSPSGLLDLDDLSPELAQQPGAERRGDARAGVDDPHTFERALLVDSSDGRARPGDMWDRRRGLHWSSPHLTKHYAFADTLV